MNTSLVAGYLPVINSEQLGTVKATTASITSEWTSEVTSSAPRQNYTDESLMNVWVMIGAILGCLTIMIAVVIASATSMS